MASKHTSKKSISKIPPETAERVVAISLKYPDLGARRLVHELKKKRISLSATTIQSILRRHGLQNREKRLAKIKKQLQKPKAFPKKSFSKVPDKTAERIVELSLKYPEHGARRLAAELEKKKIVVSASTVYNILKRRGLQTRDKRLAKAAEKVTEPVMIPRTFPGKIPPEVEDRIVEISLQNPECGARRLMPLLQQEEIVVSASAVYRILKRNGLENRQKRLLKLKAQQTPEAPTAPGVEAPEHLDTVPEMEPVIAITEASLPVFGPAVGAPLPIEDKTPALAEEPEPVAEPAVAAPARAERPPVRKAPLKTIKKRG